jgi:hypothetical protein
LKLSLTSEAWQKQVREGLDWEGIIQDWFDFAAKIGEAVV